MTAPSGRVDFPLDGGDVSPSALAPLPLRAETVERSRLLDLIPPPHGFSCTLVNAPAGYGKSVFLTQWYRTQPPNSVAWFSVAEYQDDPVTFWIGVTRALRQAVPGFGANYLEMLMSPDASLIGRIMPRILHELDRLPRNVSLILDDLHRIGDSEVLESLDAFIGQAPQKLRLLISARSEPKLALSRLRASGHLFEVDASDLRFSFEEAAELLRATSPDLLDEQIRTAMTRTAGWAVGLALAAMALLDHEDRGAFLEAFDGRDRTVTAYLADEVLSGYSEEDQRWLLETSILETLEPSSCNAVARVTDSGARLVHMSRGNAFISPLDQWGERYRYHALVRDCLKKQLTDRDYAAYVAAEQRAAHFYMDTERPGRAFTHAMAASDRHLAATIAGRAAYDLIASGRSRTLRTQIDALGEDILADHPDLAMAAAMLLILEGSDSSPIEIERLVTMAERSSALSSQSASDLNWYGEALRSSFTYVGVEQVRATASRLLTTGPTALHGPVIAGLAAANFFSGRISEAEKTNRVMMERLDAGVNLLGDIERVLALGHRAVIMVELGNLDEAEEFAETAVKLAVREDGSIMPLVFYALIALARIDRLRGNLVDAERHLRRALNLTPSWSLPRILALLTLVEVKIDEGDLETARKHLALARDAIEDHEDPGILPVEHRRLKKLIGVETGPVPSPTAELTERELDVLRLLRSPLSNREMAERLYISINTMKSHLKAIYRKLGVSSRDEAVLVAIERGLDVRRRSSRAT